MIAPAAKRAGNWGDLSDVTDRNGYSRLSIVNHWIAAIAVIVLFVTHEADRGSAGYLIHVSGGAVVGIYLLWRIWFRVGRGFAAKPRQAMIFNIASQIVMWGFLTAIVLVVITGYLLPWSLGQPLDLFGMVAIPSPIGPSRGVHEFVEEVHEIAGEAFVPLLALHLLGAAKHAVINKDGVAARMFRSTPNGR